MTEGPVRASWGEPGTDPGEESSPGERGPGDTPAEDEPANAAAAEGVPGEGGGEPGLAEQLQEERALKEKYLAGWQRAQAGLENLKKQVARDMASARAAITEELVRDMLPALDGLERAVQHASELGTDEAVCQGLSLVMGKFLEFLAREGVEPISAAGQHFDPRRHEAILQIPTDGVDEGTVVEEIQRGYASRERVIRPALVAVACRAGATPSAESEGVREEE